MKPNISLCGFLLFACLLSALPAYSEEVIEFNLEIQSADGVTANGESSVASGSNIDEDNVSDFDFGEGGFMVVKCSTSGVKYRVESSQDLEFLGNALGNNTDGVVIGRWVVGGSVKSIERSTLLSLDKGTKPFLPRASVPDLPAATPAGP